MTAWTLPDGTVVEEIEVCDCTGQELERGRVCAQPHCPNRPRCESGWTGDRCTYPLFHEGPHSNP